MNHINFLGLELILTIQENFGEYLREFKTINELSNPEHGYTVICPFVATIDAVLGAQCFASVAACGWSSVLIKWTLNEYRPFWWWTGTIQHKASSRGMVKFNLWEQSCDTSPGSPSGHIMSVTCLCMLIISWTTSAIFPLKRSCLVTIFQMVIFFLLFLISCAILAAVGLTRLWFVANFPHQCILGFIFALIILRIVNHCVVYPTVTIKRKYYAGIFMNRTWINYMYLIAAIGISVGQYWFLKLCGIDPHWGEIVAYKFCPKDQFILISTMPIYIIAVAVGTFLGFTMVASPYLQKSRFNSPNRNILLAFASSIFFRFVMEKLEETLPPKDESIFFYFCIGCFCAIRVWVFVKAVSFCASLGEYWRRRTQPLQPFLPHQNYIPENIRSRCL